MTQAPITRGSHAVRFFENEERAHRTIAEFFSEDARLDDCCMMIAKVETFAGVRQVLEANPVTRTLAERIRFFAVDEQQLGQFLIGDEITRERAEEFFLHVLSYVPASGANARIRLYGEMGDLLCIRGQHATALQMEDFAGFLFALEPRLSILCGYRINRFAGETRAAALRAVCAKHSDVGPLLDISAPPDTHDEKTALPAGGTSAEAALRVVYVVDDDASMRRSLGRLLTLSNFRVRTLDSAEAFLKEAGALFDGCVVLDMQLGGMSGLDLLALLAERGIRLPVIAMSGFSDEKTESEALRLGARTFLHKPFEPKFLLDAVARVLGLACS